MGLEEQLGKTEAPSSQDTHTSSSCLPPCPQEELRELIQCDLVTDPLLVIARLHPAYGPITDLNCF